MLSERKLQHSVEEMREMKTKMTTEQSGVCVCVIAL